MKYTTLHEDQTIALGKTLAASFSGGEVLCLYGDLGAGKTTLTTGIIRYFLPDARVLSPTFTLVRQYTLTSEQIEHLYHIDLYRLNSEREISEVGVFEWMHAPKTLVIIEWPERMGGHLPSKRLEIHCKMLPDDSHEFEVKHYDN